MAYLPEQDILTKVLHKAQEIAGAREDRTGDIINVATSQISEVVPDIAGSLIDCGFLDLSKIGEICDLLAEISTVSFALKDGVLFHVDQSEDLLGGTELELDGGADIDVDFLSGMAEKLTGASKSLAYIPNLFEDCMNIPTFDPISGILGDLTGLLSDIIGLKSLGDIGLSGKEDSIRSMLLSRVQSILSSCNLIHGSINSEIANGLRALAMVGDLCSGSLVNPEVDGSPIQVEGIPDIDYDILDRVSRTV